MNADTVTPLEQIATLNELLEWRIEQTPESDAYRYFNAAAGKWQSYRWEQIGERVESWRRALAASELPPGARVAVLLPNGIDAVCIDQAALAQGLATVPMHALDNPESIAYIVRDCEASMLVVSTRGQWEQIAALGPTSPALKLVVVVDEVFSLCNLSPPLSPVLIMSLLTWLAGNASAGISARPEVNADTLASIVYTSGTTGKPKGVMLTHGNVLSNVKGVLAGVHVLQSDLFLSVLPLSHTFERTVGYYLPMAAGSCVAYNRSVAQLSEDLAVIRPTVLVSVPRIYERSYGLLQDAVARSGALTRVLFGYMKAMGWRDFCRRQGMTDEDGAGTAWLDHALLPALRLLVARKVLARFGGRVRMAVCGGAPLPGPVAELFLAMGLPLLQGYGMTETSPVVTCNTPQDNWPHTVGRTLPGVEIRLGENSELQVRGEGVMQAYWRRPEESALAFVDGWLRTGDQAAIENGRVRIIGRIKEIIVTSTGEKIAPADLELAIAGDTLFEQVFVTGEGQPFIAAFVVLNPNGWRKLARELKIDPDYGVNLRSPLVRSILLQRVRLLCRDFPHYAIPRTVCVTDVPWTLQNGLLTPTLKLKRRALLSHFSADIETIYAPSGRLQASASVSPAMAA